MSTDLDETGPIDYLVVEFPGNRMTGEGFPLLVDLVDSGAIRILDLVFITRDTDALVLMFATGEHKWSQLLSPPAYSWSAS